jgi:phenylalanyl-tRNA synthetase beta chain
MRAPLSWLQSLTPLAVSPTDRAAVAALAGELDALGLVVEGIERVGEGLGDVVLAQVVDIAAIPGADRIRRVVVDRGSGESVEVVCGAWNFAVGDVVPFIPVGAELPGGLTIERRKMKGVVSNGMICSARELALGDDHEGIMVLASPADAGGSFGHLPAGVELGRSLADHLGIGPDVVFDLDIEANRPDCMCMLGVARDLSARFNLPLHTPEPVVAESDPPADTLASVAIDAPELCFRLTGRVLTNVVAVPSPMVVQRRLMLAGMRPIGAVVDASNYVMLELGQPTHPYDLDQLGGRGLRARAAGPGETIVTLDGETRTLGARRPREGDLVTALDCLICNADDVPVGIGGIMGGRSSEVTEATSSILLEAAGFVGVAIGRTARYVGLRSEASVRFERGIDTEGIERASARVCELVVQAAKAAGVAPPVVARGLLDAEAVRFGRIHISVRPRRVNALLGTELSSEAMTDLLTPIGYSVSESRAGDGAEPGVFEVAVPSFRPDVRREVDVTEDIARTFGYRNIPRTDRRSPHVGRIDAVQQLRRRLRGVLSGLGAHEAWTSSIVDPAVQARAGWPGDVVRLTNPMVAEESALRPGLLAGLLTAVRYNSGHRHPWIRLFEIGDIFVPRSGVPSDELPFERERLALVLAREDDSAETAMLAWRVVADACGVVGVNVVRPGAGHAGDTALPVSDGETGPRRRPGSDRPPAAGPASAAPAPAGPAPASNGGLIGLLGLHPARSALLEVAGADLVLGAVGEIDPDVMAAFGLPHQRIGWLEIDMAVLSGAPRRPELAQPVSRYPSSDVDLAFTVDEIVPACRVEAILREAGTELCESVELFDVYRGPGVEESKRSLAYRVRFCALDRTLTDSEVAELRRRCIDAVQSALPATLRS